MQFDIQDIQNIEVYCDDILAFFLIEEATPPDTGADIPEMRKTE